MKRNKFNAIKTTIDDIRFDSRLEAARYTVLKARQDAGEIVALECHVPYDLVVSGQKIAKYVADFRYRLLDGSTIVEDVKSPASMTPVFRLKAKLLKAVHGVDVAVVMTPSA